MSRPKKTQAGVTVLACGCEHNDAEWLKVCAPCGIAMRVVQQRWDEERRNPSPVLTTRYHGQAKPLTNEDLI